ncbi:MAG: hypothetical protein IT531_00190 [Burkholderiales bacterium]|nr:hypothetical protein [Burkholderiales bacterium]
MATRREPARRRPTKSTRLRARVTFLSALAEGLSVTLSAERACIGRDTAYDWRARDAEFLRAWESAIEQGTDLLEDEARRRAVDGIPNPVYQGGQRVGTVQMYSDRLLELLLRARRPAVYRERQSVEHSGPNGGPLQHESVEPRPAMAPAEWLRAHGVDIEAIAHGVGPAARAADQRTPG